MKKGIIIAVIVIAVIVVVVLVKKQNQKKADEKAKANSDASTSSSDTSTVGAETLINTIVADDTSELSISDPMHPDFQAGIQPDGSFVG